MKYRAEYFGYATGLAQDGNAFPVVRSNDLVEWKSIGGAMKLLENSPPFYWAPEVSYLNGRFYLYYSVGNETLMEIRVAVSDRPDGGFIDAGRKLTTEDFAIDPHVFIDDDGQMYMFYATDFLKHTHIGTGTVMDKMIDPLTLEGRPKVITRAQYDWQVYDPNRAEKGGVRWHTVEGPAVIKRKGHYYEMFSAGNWKNISYGVSFASSPSLLNAAEWTQISNGLDIMPVLRTIPDKVIGPGHNSIVRGPNNRELFCVYHSWVGDERVMAIDRMNIVGRRLFVAGATTTPQFAPFRPAIFGFEKRFSVEGDWEFDRGSARVAGAGRCEMIFEPRQDSFYLEFNLRFADSKDPEGTAGFELRSEESLLKLAIDSKLRRIELRDARQSKNISLPSGLDLTKDLLVRVDVNAKRTSIVVGANNATIQASTAEICRRVVLFSDGAECEFAAFALTEGFEELFEGGEASGIMEPWHASGKNVSFVKETSEVLLDGKEKLATLSRPIGPAAELQFEVNIRAVDPRASDGQLGLLLTFADGTEMRFGISDNGKALFITSQADLLREFSGEADALIYCQLRVLKAGEELIAYCNGTELGKVDRPGEVTEVGAFCENTEAAVEMVSMMVI
jgi:GH43 family beta-xylosidase